MKNTDYLIYNLFEEDVVRFSESNEIIIYGNINEAKEDAKKLGVGYFIHKVSDALPNHQLEIKNQINNGKLI
jgi:hypothetical protein|tara:strand:+ start:33 stop:248 length:216 start_codon:yes stop_codon:yes gene_type:complete